MLDVLNVEDDRDGSEIEDSGPEPEVASPCASKVVDLNGSLHGDGCQDGREQDLGNNTTGLADGLCWGEHGHQPYHLGPKVPILLDRLRGAFPHEVPHGADTKDEAKGRDRSNPDIEEAGRKVVAEGAERAPALTVST